MDDNFVQEEGFKNEFIQFKSKPTNILDFIRFQEDENYLKYKMKEKIKQNLQKFKFDERIIDEICEKVNLIKKKHKNMKFQTILQILTIKVIKKYNIALNLQQIKENFGNKFNLSNFLKHKKEIDPQKTKNEEIFQNLKTSLNFFSIKLKQYFKENPNSFKIKENDLNQIEFIANKLLQQNNNSAKTIKSESKEKSNKIALSQTMNIDEIITQLKQEIAEQLPSLFYNTHKHEDSTAILNTFNHSKIIGALFLNKLNSKGIKVTIETISNIFNVPKSSLSKYSKLYK